MTDGPTRADPSEPVRDGGPQEAAHFLMDAIGELAKLARAHDHHMLSYLLDMAHLEAKETVRSGGHSPD